MKKIIILTVLTLLTSLFGLTQSVENLDFISPFHDDVAAIKKSDLWAFINKEGVVVVNFRNDLVTTKTKDKNYPIFKDDRCLIVKNKKGISYYGYINKKGEIVIEPQFLKATNFNNKVATTLKLVKENGGRNELLDKDIVYYKYYEVLIDAEGIVTSYLIPDATYLDIDKKFYKLPKFKSKMLSNNLYAILAKNNKWAIIKIDN